MNTQEPIIIAPTSHAQRLESVAGTVQQRLNLVQNRLDAESAAERPTNATPDPRYVAANQLANTQPDLMALIMAVQLGKERLGVDVDDARTQTVDTVTRVFGIPIGRQTETLRTTRKTHKKLTA